MIQTHCDLLIFSPDGKPCGVRVYSVTLDRFLDPSDVEGKTWSETPPVKVWPGVSLERAHSSIDPSASSLPPVFKNQYLVQLPVSDAWGPRQQLLIEAVIDPDVPEVGNTRIDRPQPFDWKREPSLSLGWLASWM